MLCSGLGGKMFAAVYIESHYLVDLQNGPNQVHLREICSLRTNSQMENDLGIGHLNLSKKSKNTSLGSKLKELCIGEVDLFCKMAKSQMCLKLGFPFLSRFSSQDFLDSRPD